MNKVKFMKSLKLQYMKDFWGDMQPYINKLISVKMVDTNPIDNI
jgi:hypothetical protein